jgi:glutaredoxin 3
MAKVEIYTTTFCPFCSRAMRLLASKEVSVEEIDITWGGPKRDEMLKRANGRTSVPQVFINSVHIGGSDDLAALDRAGELDALLTS